MQTIDIDRVAECDTRMIEIAKALLPNWNESDPELHQEHRDLWIERQEIIGAVFDDVPTYIREMIQAHTMLGEAIARVHYPTLDRDGNLWRSWCTCGQWESDEIEDGNEVIRQARAHLDA